MDTFHESSEVDGDPPESSDNGNQNLGEGQNLLNKNDSENSIADKDKINTEQLLTENNNAETLLTQNDRKNEQMPEGEPNEECNEKKSESREDSNGVKEIMTTESLDLVSVSNEPDLGTVNGNNGLLELADSQDTAQMLSTESTGNTELKLNNDLNIKEEMTIGETQVEDSEDTSNMVLKSFSDFTNLTGTDNIDNARIVDKASLQDVSNIINSQMGTINVNGTDSIQKAAVLDYASVMSDNSVIGYSTAGSGEVSVGIDGVQYVMADDGSATAVVGAHGSEDAEALLHKLVSETLPPASSSSNTTTTIQGNIMVTTSNNITQDFGQHQQQQGALQNFGQTQQILTQELVQALPQALTQAATLVNTNLNLAGGNAGAPTKIVIQTNQANSPQKIAQPLLIQVGGSSGGIAPVISAPMQLQQQLQQQQQQQQQQQSMGPGMVMTGGKSHFVIRSGQNSFEQQQQEQSPTQGNNIFKIIVPEGTTKYTKPISPVKSNEPVRKHIQINLSDGSLRNSGANRFNRAGQGKSVDYDRDVEEIPGGDSKRYYECATCHSRFMRPLYLRKHMRSCKKVEVKQEKTPLYMCSFCKMTFKTKPQINQHFLRCYHSPYAKKAQGLKRKGEEEDDLPQSKKGRMGSAEIDPALEQAVQFRCQDCDRTFSKERQYSSHIKRCTKISVHDLTGARTDLATGEEEEEEELDTAEDPFADPRPSPPRRGRGGGRRGRPPGRGANATLSNARRTNYLFEGSPPIPSTSGLLVADNEGLVRSTTGLAHTVLLSLETASQEGNPQPMALVADSKGVRGRPQAPQAWSLVCALCQKMFITKQALATHVMTEHGPDLVHMRSTLDGTLNSTKPLYRCPVCSLAFEEEEQFLEHLVLQHTAKLQETFSKMQGQSATFVCSLCSLVLLTRNLLMEHLSLIHLDELETLAQGDDTHIDINSSHAQINSTQATTRILQTQGGQVMVKQEGSNNVGGELVDAFECGFCGDHLQTQEAMMEHYVSVHGVETDDEGALLDLGLDVDIRVKDTKSLLLLADGQADDTLPEKTVLIRKKPRQSWQCKECQQVFSKHFDFLRHVREVCPDAGLSPRGSLTRGNNFKCQQPGCSHLSFYQFKTLVKHMEEIHKVIIPREVKTFKNLALFYQWLSGEEKKYNVRYIRDTTRIEKNDMKLIQMVCHRFHTAKNDSLREAKEEMEAAEGESPAKAKRRWFVRIQRSGNCHARIHLKVSYNPHSVDYDGETQMVYYPQHTHTDGDHPPELMDRVMDRHNNHREKGIARNRNELSKTKSRMMDGLNTQGIEGGDSSDQLLDMSGQTMNMVLADPTGNGEGQQVIITTGSDGIKMERELTMDQYMAEFCQTQLEGEGVDGSGGSTAMVVTTSGADGTTTSTILQPARASAGVVVEGVGQSGNTTTLAPGTMFVGGGGASGVQGVGGMQLVESAGEPGTYVVQDGSMVMNVAQAEADKDQGAADTEEYVLPADESEWTKLFDVLRLRLVTTELSEQEKTEGEGLLPYQNVISYLPLTEQVTIFQQLCMLTNTAIETAD